MSLNVCLLNTPNNQQWFMSIKTYGDELNGWSDCSASSKLRIRQSHRYRIRQFRFSADTGEIMRDSAKKAWHILLHAHDHCLSADGRMLIHRLMVKVIEDDWRLTENNHGQRH